MKTFLMIISLLCSFNTFSKKKKAPRRSFKRSSNKILINNQIKKSTSSGEGSTCNNVINMQGQRIKLDLNSHAVENGQGHLYNPDTQYNTLDFGGHGHATNNDRRFVVQDANVKVQTEFVFVNAYNGSNGVILKFKNQTNTISLKQKNSVPHQDCYAIDTYNVCCPL